MWIVCLDLESILIPEIWQEIAKKLKIKELELTTRDVPNFDLLMKKRLEILRKNNLKIQDLQKVIRKIKPFQGALPFLNWLRENFPVIILSDTFLEFWKILIKKLNYPTLFCNNFQVDKNGFIENYKIRKKNGKLQAVRALKSLGFKIICVGDSYNDISMLKEANVGILFRSSDKIKKEFRQFKNVKSYRELKKILKSYIQCQ
jgi:phosphoserine/homoserine phosphotransferase